MHRTHSSGHLSHDPPHTRHNVAERKTHSTTQLPTASLLHLLDPLNLKQDKVEVLALEHGRKLAHRLHRVVPALGRPLGLAGPGRVEVLGQQREELGCGLGVRLERGRESAERARRAEERCRTDLNDGRKVGRWQSVAQDRLDVGPHDLDVHENLKQLRKVDP